MTIHSANRIARRPILAATLTALTGVLVSLGLLSASADRAEAALTNNVPSHQIGAWFYDGYGLGVNPPRKMAPFGNGNCLHGELVKWSPDLYRWNGRKWGLYDGSAPWYQAVTSIYGFCQVYYTQAWSAPSGMQVLFHRFGALRPGYYAIRNYMKWVQQGRTHAHWSDTIHIVPAS